MVMLVADFDKQIRLGTFEHTLCHVVDQCLDLSLFSCAGATQPPL
jgi:hypothetical protein